MPELKAAANSDNPVIRDTLKYAQMLEGNVRSTGVHAWCDYISNRYFGYCTNEYCRRQNNQREAVGQPSMMGRLSKKLGSLRKWTS